MGKKVWYIRNHQIIKREIAGQFLLIPLKRLKKNQSIEKLFVLNSTSSFIWDILNKKHTFGQITSEILKKFTNTDKETVEKDVNDILKEFLKRNLVTKT